MATNKIKPNQREFILVSTADGDGWQSRHDTSVVVLTEQAYEDVVDTGYKIKHLDGYDLVSEVSITELIKSHNELIAIKVKARGYQTKVDGVAAMFVRDGRITSIHTELRAREIIFDHYPEEEDIAFRGDVEASVYAILNNQEAA